MSFGKFGFIAAEVTSVAGDDDFIFDGNSQFFQLFKISFGAVISVNDLSSNIATSRISVPAFHKVGMTGIRIFFQGIFLLIQDFAFWRDHFYQRFARAATHIDVVGIGLDIQTGLTHALNDVVFHFFVGWRPSDVWVFG
ncbi:hypothetical protein [Psychroflexus montanilacus]|uniref:hypothetical protein n=1 Tax=Psychroflexus montanilacus TaxID=2873598 RepID=UPI001CC9F4E3|nr:hypothetical protein [Psychroflexus montanilacus]MBZ9650987.1 hypothetical protein [Psychroflexus montanilacus]